MAEKDAFGVGDKVVCRGEPGEVVEVAGPPGDPTYSVRLAPWERVEEEYEDELKEKKVRVSFRHPKDKSRTRGHEADVPGGVKGWELTKKGA